MTRDLDRYLRQARVARAISQQQGDLPILLPVRALHSRGSAAPWAVVLIDSDQEL